KPAQADADQQVRRDQRDQQEEQYVQAEQEVELRRPDAAVDARLVERQLALPQPAPDPQTDRRQQRQRDQADEEILGLGAHARLSPQPPGRKCGIATAIETTANTIMPPTQAQKASAFSSRSKMLFLGSLNLPV